MVGINHTEIRKVKEYAIDNNIPIMQDDGIDYLTTFIIKHQIKNVLEIGTAVGYSAIMMALTKDDLKITSIERDDQRYLEALKNVKNFGLEKRISLIFRDALEVKLEDKYDLIFIDAAKGQNINFFETFERNLLPGGYIITDNMNFHGYLEKNLKDVKSRNLRGLIRKIGEYKVYLENNINYETKFYELGDGIAVSHKKK